MCHKSFSFNVGQPDVFQINNFLIPVSTTKCGSV